MEFQIIGDSCMDLTEEMHGNPQHFRTIPLSIEVGGSIVKDDMHFNQADLLARIKASPDCPKTACPSPEDFLKAYEESRGDIYVITLSDKLSGTGNAARLAKQLYEEKHGALQKNIAVIDSASGCAGESRLGLYCCDLCKKGLPFSEVTKRLHAYVKKLQTFFVLEDLSTLRKNGRLSGTAAFFATALNIKPVLFAKDGEIQKYDQTRGIDRALRRMCAAAVSCAEEFGTLPKKNALPSQRIRSHLGELPLRAVIAHCNAPARAQLAKEELGRLADFDRIDIADTGGVSTVYASDGGVVVAI